jgi:hypothetical protein
MCKSHETIPLNRHCREIAEENFKNNRQEIAEDSVRDNEKKLLRQVTSYIVVKNFKNKRQAGP